jgi:type VI protein secretion system component VasF
VMMRRVVSVMLAFGMLSCVVHAQAPKASAEERQKKLLADAEQLRTMAQALKASVDATKKDELSVKVVHQAEQIEKLAKAVKEQQVPR